MCKVRSTGRYAGIVRNVHLSAAWHCQEVSIAGYKTGTANTVVLTVEGAGWYCQVAPTVRREVHGFVSE